MSDCALELEQLMRSGGQAQQARAATAVVVHNDVLYGICVVTHGTGYDHPGFSSTGVSELHESLDEEVDEEAVGIGSLLPVSYRRAR